MAKLTWRELIEFVNSESFNSDLNSFVCVYDMKTGEEKFCDVIELKNFDDSWTPFIGINISDDTKVE
jgi:hypothetical protein